MVSVFKEQRSKLLPSFHWVNIDNFAHQRNTKFNLKAKVSSLYVSLYGSIQKYVSWLHIAPHSHVVISVSKISLVISVRFGEAIIFRLEKWVC